MQLLRHIFFLSINIFLSGCINSVDNKSLTTATQLPALSRRLVQPNNEVTQPVVKIMQLLGVKQVAPRVDAFVEQNFTRFMRGRNVERWEMRDNFDEETQAALIEQFKILGFFEEVQPLAKQYDYLVMYSASLHTFRERARYAKDLWQRGVRCKQVIFLTSERPLVAFENRAALADRAQTVLPIRTDWQEPAQMPTKEHEMLPIVWDQAELPADLKALPRHIVVSTMKTYPDGTTRRAHTGDTVEDWVAQKPQPGSCLFISNQPYVGYQGGIARRLMPKEFSIEIVGAAPRSEQKSVSVLVDTLLRWLAFEARLAGLWSDATLQSYLNQ